MSNQPPASLSLADIVARLGGQLTGDPSQIIRQVATLEQATPDSIAFFANERYQDRLQTTGAGAVIAGRALPELSGRSHIVTVNPYAYFARVSALLNPAQPVEAMQHASSVIHSGARIGEGVHIAPHVVIEEGAVIGDGCHIGAGSYVGAGASVGDGGVLHPNVTVYHGCSLGKRIIVHAGVVIGADGFGIAMDEGRWIKIPQIGRVRIGDDVEIGANTTIDRGAMDDTVIEDGVKLDNQIQIAHNVFIGAHTAIAACAGVAGSAHVGRHCKIGGASGIAGHIRIADNVEISAHTLITKSIAEAGTYTGAYPFEINRDWRRNAVGLRNLAELTRRIRALEMEMRKKDRS